MNTGFAGGINIGIKHSKGDLILFLNSDIVHEPDFLMEMLNFFKNKKVPLFVFFKKNFKTLLNCVFTIKPQIIKTNCEVD